jgi:hypothetical protein
LGIRTKLFLDSSYLEKNSLRWWLVNGHPREGREVARRRDLPITLFVHGSFLPGIKLIYYMSTLVAIRGADTIR